MLPSASSSSTRTRVSRISGEDELRCLSPEKRHRLCVFDNVCACVRRDVWERHPFQAAAIAEDLALRAIRRTVEGGPDRNIRALGGQLRRPETRAAAAAPAETPDGGRPAVPVSRACRVRADLLHVAGRAAEAARQRPSR